MPHEPPAVSRQEARPPRHPADARGGGTRGQKPVSESSQAGSHEECTPTRGRLTEGEGPVDAQPRQSAPEHKQTLEARFPPRKNQPHALRTSAHQACGASGKVSRLEPRHQGRAGTGDDEHPNPTTDQPPQNPHGLQGPGAGGGSNTMLEPRASHSCHTLQSPLHRGPPGQRPHDCGM